MTLFSPFEYNQVACVPFVNVKDCHFFFLVNWYTPGSLSPFYFFFKFPLEKLALRSLTACIR